MKKKNLIVFANFLIDSYERFLRLKDSYNSLKTQISTHGSLILEVHIKKKLDYSYLKILVKKEF